jgi:hypothetical protein
MSKKSGQQCKFTSEQAIQDWLEELVASDKLHAAIKGADKVNSALRDWESPEFWPDFPIDYLARLRNLRAAQSVFRSLHSLELVSKNRSSISQTKGESLFVDLLYCNRERSQFIIVEVKNQRASVRETVTELLAYEHEILNHITFAGSNDILMVVVSREFSTLLDHAITGLNTWSRRKILCLRLDDADNLPRLVTHIPTAWAAIGQKTLSANGLVTACLTFDPHEALTSEQIHAACDTAAELLVREAERAGGSGFAIVMHDHLYPKVTQSPYYILAGAVNPFSFLPEAEAKGFVDETSSPISKYVLEGGVLGDLSIGWDWLGSDGGAAVEYLEAYGHPTWEGLSTWSNFRDVRRWRHDGLTPDRHLMPVSVDFWGVLGDYARDIVRHQKRLKNFMPGITKPGLDWRSPRLGVLLLDEIAIKPIVQGGQWTFSTLFAFGMRLGRLIAITAQFADANEKTKRLLLAAVFWAEADAAAVLHEVAWRYQSAKEITEAPPTIPIGLYDSGEKIVNRIKEFASWFRRAFIGPKLQLMDAAFVTGLNSYGLYDKQFDVTDSDPNLKLVKAHAVAMARDWLKWTAVAATGDAYNSATIVAAVAAAFGGAIPLDRGKETALEAIDKIDEEVLVDNLFETIPRLCDLWHPQLFHTLAPLSTVDRDWDWYEDQIRAARARGEKYPCIFLSAGGQIGIGNLPSDHPGVPHISNPDKEVLYADNESFAEIIIAVTWEALRAGQAPGMHRPVVKKDERRKSRKKPRA